MIENIFSLYKTVNRNIKNMCVAAYVLLLHIDTTFIYIFREIL